MEIGHIEGTTRVCGKSQGFLGLPLRDGARHCSVARGEVPTMTSAWFPNPEELVAINAGAAIHVHIDGTTPAPMMVTVGPPPDRGPIRIGDGVTPGSKAARGAVPPRK